MFDWLGDMKSLRSIIALAAVCLASVSLSAAEGPAEFSAGALKFTRPADWIWVPATSPMRKAEMKVESKDKKSSAEVVFYYFGPGQGGNAQANAERWFGQFSDGRDNIHARTEEKSVNGDPVTFVFAEGTYMSGPPMGQKTPMKDYALVGAIIEDAGGSIFVKMTGPKEITMAAEAKFRKMVESAKK